MQDSFTYSALDQDMDVRKDIREVNRAAWQRLARAGSWWTGAERIAIAAEVRNARQCSLCRERRDALSPESVQGEHDHLGNLSTTAVDAIHRLVNDAGRLSRSWYGRTIDASLTDAHYVELLGVVVTVVSIDSFHHGIDVPLEPLPEPITGEPTKRRPALVRDEGAYVPMLPVDAARGEEADLWEGEGGGNVLRALSLVPDEVRMLRDLSAIYYLPIPVLAKPRANAGRALDRGQIELLAGRVSAVNECFY